jgi:hypothetical protein
VASSFGKLTYAFASFKDDHIKVGLTFLEEQASFAAQVSEKGRARVNLDFSLDLFRMEHPSLFAEPPSSSAPSAAAPSTSAFQQALAALPAAGAPGAAAAYTALVAQFGTHYVSRQDVGGFCNFTVEFDEAATANMTVEYVDNPAAPLCP